MYLKNKINFYIITSIIIFFIIISVVGVFAVPLKYLNYVFLYSLFGVAIAYIFFWNFIISPTLILIGTLILFQGGLIIASVFDKTIDIKYVILMGANYYLSDNTVRISFLLIIISCWSILLGSIFAKIGLINRKQIFKNSSVTKIEIKEKDKYLFLLIFILSLPFTLFKLKAYVSYFLTYGYMGFYRSSSYLNDAGLIIRLLSYLTPISFIGYFLLEHDKKKNSIIIIIYFFISVVNAIMGFRGSFLTFWITVFLFYNYKYQKKLSALKIILLIISIAVFSLLISNYRDYGKIANLEIVSNPIIVFLKQQGVSFYVTAMTIDYYDYFYKNTISYLLYGIIGGILPSYLNYSGRALAVDLMKKINMQGYLQGYGTGSSFLAESYLLGGQIGVLIVSFFLGFIITKLYTNFDKKNIYAKIIIFIFFQYVFFLPRDFLMMPVSIVIKTTVYLILLSFVIIILKSIIRYSFLQYKDNLL